LLAAPDALLAGLEEFREHLGGGLTITLLRGIGDPVDVHEIDHGLLRGAIAALVG
jgi:3-dehydroquinate synthase